MTHVQMVVVGVVKDQQGFSPTVLSNQAGYGSLNICIP